LKDGRVRSPSRTDRFRSDRFRSADLRRTLGRGELVPLVYRLGLQAASGVLTLTVRTSRPEVFVLRRGGALCVDGELARRALAARLARAAAEASIAAGFDGGVTACPPGTVNQLTLAGWARAHLEAQLDGPLADALLCELAGCRLALRPELRPEPRDDTDRRMLAALAQPRRLDQLWPLARAPRFRLLAFLHFVRATGALDVEGAAPARSAPARGIDARRAAAMRLLGIGDADDTGAVKRAYRRLARALHPDLQPEIDEQRRRTLERRFAELTAAYEALV
jgi:DnaJ-domain-containing protein 1